MDDSATFTCLTAGDAKWYFSSDGNPEHSTLIISEKSTLSSDTLSKSVVGMFRGMEYVINMVELEDDGYYFCSGSDPDTDLPFMARARLKVYGEYPVYNLNK